MEWLFALDSYTYVALVLAFSLLILPDLDRGKDLHRSVVTIACGLLVARYFYWRLTATILPFHGTTAQEWWVWIVFAAEFVAVIEIMLFLVIMSKSNNQSDLADIYEVDVSDSEQCPSVDVMIPTYNEPIDVLEKTIIGGLNIDYPNYTLHVLDDGKRDWLKAFCEKHGANYIRRPTNEHAKAGNINYALSVTHAELFAIFDADFVPGRDFLKRTVGFFTNDQSIGLVQTPQHFFNKDPVQSNLYLQKLFPDEQRLFFSEMAPARDAWNASFCCGSCSINRREAIEKVGGIPTASITEDLLTTLALLQGNYRTVYLNEKLSQGLAADSLEAFFVQRERWCQGGIQCMYVKEGPLRAKHLNLMQRLLFMPLGWLIQAPTRIMVVAIPIVYFWTGLQPLQMTTGFDIMSYLVPVVLMNLVAMTWLSNRRYIPVLSTAIGVFSAFRMLPTVVSSVVKPFGTAFKVTPKGSDTESSTDYFTLYASLVMMALTLGGIYVNLVPELAIIPSEEFFPFALIWAALNVIYLMIAFLISFDAPRHRKEERFDMNERAYVGEDDGTKHYLRMRDLSLTGASFDTSDDFTLERDARVIIDIKGVGQKEAVILNSRSVVTVQFTDDVLRNELICKLFSGDYTTEVSHADDIIAVLNKVSERGFGSTAK